MEKRILGGGPNVTRQSTPGLGSGGGAPQTQQPAVDMAAVQRLQQINQQQAAELQRVAMANAQAQANGVIDQKNAIMAEAETLDGKTAAQRVADFYQSQLEQISNGLDNTRKQKDAAASQTWVNLQVQRYGLTPEEGQKLRQYPMQRVAEVADLIVKARGGSAPQAQPNQLAAIRDQRLTSGADRAGGAMASPGSAPEPGSQGELRGILQRGGFMKQR